MAKAPQSSRSSNPLLLGKAIEGIWEHALGSTFYPSCGSFTSYVPPLKMSQHTPLSDRSYLSKYWFKAKASREFDLAKLFDEWHDLHCGTGTCHAWVQRLPSSQRIHTRKEQSSHIQLRCKTSWTIWTPVLDLSIAWRGSRVQNMATQIAVRPTKQFKSKRNKAKQSKAANKQTNKQTDRQTDRQTDKQTNKQTTLFNLTNQHKLYKYNHNKKKTKETQKSHARTRVWQKTEMASFLTGKEREDTLAVWKGQHKQKKQKEKDLKENKQPITVTQEKQQCNSGKSLFLQMPPRP